MAAKSSTFDNDLLKLIFNATPIANLSDNAAGAPLTNLYVSLHTSSPAVGGSQSTNEAAYTGYARVALARTAGGWTVTGSSVSPAATISFPTATAGTETEAFFAVGTASAGAGKVLYFGALAPAITIAAGGIPQLTTASAITES